MKVLILGSDPVLVRPAVELDDRGTRANRALRDAAAFTTTQDLIARPTKA